MKKLVLFSILVLNLAFGVDYETLANRCVSGDGQACNRLANMCNENDGNACYWWGGLLYSLGESLENKDREKSQTYYKAGRVTMEWGCYKLNNQNCCSLLKDMR